MADLHAARDLISLSQVSGGVLAAFVLVGALSLVILQVYASLPSRNVPGAYSADSETSGERVMRPVRESELSIANGEDGCPLYVAVADPFSSSVTVFDMEAGREFYGPGGPYHLFAGRNATVGLAKSSLSPAAMDDDISSLTASERDTHAQWYAKFQYKYPIVGHLVRDGDCGIDTEASASLSEDAKKDN